MSTEQRDSFDPIPCPMTGCTAGLYMTLTCVIPLMEISGAEVLRDPDSAWTQEWQVECVNGHVVVLPRDDAEESHIFGDPEDPDNDDIARLSEATGWTP